MSAEVCTRVRAFVVVAAMFAALVVPAAASAQTAPATFKVAWFNIQSGKGEPAMTGHPALFPDSTNCTDATQPMNGWGIGLVQAHLKNSVGSDPKIVALGLAESWAGVCGSPENVRKVLGWKSRSSERNGVGMVAKYGFAGPEEWLQLDTSLNTNPSDTMWVLRVPVCLDSACSQSMNMFAAHWYSSGANKRTSYDRQAAQTAAFLQRAGGTAPHILIADLNAWEGTTAACGENPTNAGLHSLREAGYVDAWPLLHGSAEGFTGMTNRSGCGSPVGYTWKRPDYTWSPANYLPVSIQRFGMVTPGDVAPSDHFGLITEFPFPGAPAPAVDTVPPSVALVTPVEGLDVTDGTVSISIAASDDLGVNRVEILEDGVVAHTLTAGQTQVICTKLGTIDGAHTVAARAYDDAGNMAMSDVRHILVETPQSGPIGQSATGEVVLYAKNATTIAGNWQVVADEHAAGGARIWNPDAAMAKIAAPAVAPANYFEMTFHAEAGRAYRLWLRGRADKDYWGNDSVYVQFSGSVTQAGAPAMRIGTTDGTWVGIEDCSGCNVLGWGWQDNGYGTGVLGPLVYFAQSGTQTIRVQQREDGVSLDQIVLSPALYLTTAPGVAKLDATILPMSTGAPIAPAVMPPAEPLPITEIVIGANSVTTVGGTWKVIADASAANGTSIGTTDGGTAKVAAALAAPANYVDLTFQADAGRAYHLWVRGRADKDSWANDSIFVQFNGAVDATGKPLARTGTSDAFYVNLEDGTNAGVAGWGWQDNGYGIGVLGPVVMFDTTGPQTIRLQTREDGFRVDQIVLSAGKYLTTSPGALKNDATIVR